MELLWLGGGSTIAGVGVGAGGVSPSVVVSSSLLGFMTCLEIKGGAWSSSVVASSSLSRFITSLDFEDVGPCSWSDSAIARFRSSSSEATSMTGANSTFRT